MTYRFLDTPDAAGVSQITLEDNRRERQYGAEITLFVCFLRGRWDEPHSNAFRPKPHLTAALNRAFAQGPKGLTWMEPLRVTGWNLCGRVQWVSDCRRARMDADSYGNTYYATVRLVTAKPSHNPSEEAVRALLAGLEVDAALRQAAQDVVREYEERVAAIERVEQANHLLGALAAESRKEAKRVVRYAQRLAALEAEYHAEAAVQADALLARLDAGEDDGWNWSAEEGRDTLTPIDPRIVKAVRARLAERVAERGGGHRFGGGSQVTIEQDEVA